MNARNALYDPLALALASLVRRRAAPAGREHLADLAARLALAQAQGHVCLDLSTLERDGVPSLSGAPWPEPEKLAKAIAASDWVSGNGTTPYVLKDGLFYAQEYFYREGRMALRLAAMAVDNAPLTEDDEAALARVFGENGDTGQLAAARAVLRNRLTVVTGGPGTGKTYTLARALSLLLARGLPEDQVALCAPTGRGAARLGESLRAQLPGVYARLGLAAPNGEFLNATTLHRLLGLRRDSDRPLWHAGHPLPHALLVVDESSMMDLVMFDRLLDALAPGARLVLLGDANQLSSVGAGNVLADLTAGLPRAVAPLRVNHRFDAQGGVGALCAAVLEGAGAEKLRALATDGGFAWDSSTVSRAGVARVLEGYRALAQACEPGEALEALARFRVLSAFNEGDWGVEGVNALAQELFAGTRAVPLLVEENRPALELYNGDTGILWRPTGQLWFAQRAQPLEAALAGRVSPCWAMTIHRAQGSEYDAVCVLLGGGPASERAQGILTRELLYTGVSRARSRVELLGTPRQVESALARRVARASGLAARLMRA